MKAVTIFLTVVLSTSRLAAEAFPPPGALSCSGCHAEVGADQMLPLEGYSSDYIRATMMAFREGSLEATVMDRIAKGFSEEEIQAIAKWIGAGQ